MTYTQLIKYFGTQKAAAAYLGYCRETVRRWREQGVPIPVQERLAYRTGMKVSKK